MPEISSTSTAIRAAAEARSLLGQAAHHEMLPDGPHKVSLYDRTARRLLVGIGATVAEAVANVRQQQGGPQR
ncbi:MAG: hypothetical protein ABSG86_12615 [Thermoguttaceae bacterium]|jgi:hypothetical protein